ncbi:MAG: primosomal protein N' [Patescibacteria group bacterium]|nr:primosomal protein N' [Patescibacteria group bacterium]
MHYYKVAPIARIPLSSLQSFTYHSDESIPLGSLVEITIANKHRRGVVIEQTRKPRFPTKGILKTIYEELFTNKQLALADKISNYYFTPLGTVLKFFVPRISKSKKRKQKVKYGSGTKAPRLTKPQKRAIDKITSASASKSVLLFGPASSGKTEIILNLAEKTVKEGRQVLALIPEMFLSCQEIERYARRLKKYRVALYNSQCASSEIRYIYEGLQNGKIDVVIATRTGVFLPFRDLGLIAMDEEQDQSFKQWDQMPHYHTRCIAELLKDQYGARLICISATPSLETMHSALEKKIMTVKLPRLSTDSFRVKKPRIKIVDIRKYFKKFEPLTISDELKHHIDQVNKSDSLALLLVPRRGKSSGVICSDCKHIQRCPKCDLPLIHSKDSYHCLHCNYRKSTFSHCEKCNGLKLVDIGFGTEKVAETIKTMYPKAQVITVDANTLSNKKQRDDIYSKICNNKIDIVVGTYAIAKGFDIPRIGLAGVINADNWAGKTDFRFDERWIRNLFQLAGRLNRYGSDQNGTLIVQSFSVDERFEPLLKWDWNTFVKKELQQRKALKYPPYRQMIKLTYKDNSRKKVEKKADILHNELLGAVIEEFAVSEPYYGAVKQARGQIKKHLLLSFRKSLPAVVIGKLKKLPSGWTIDRDPEFIF